MAVGLFNLPYFGIACGLVVHVGPNMLIDGPLLCQHARLVRSATLIVVYGGVLKMVDPFVSDNISPHSLLRNTRIAPPHYGACVFSSGPRKIEVLASTRWHELSGILFRKQPLEDPYFVSSRKSPIGGFLPRSHLDQSIGPTALVL